MGIARAGSNPATIAATRHTQTFFLPSAASGPCNHVRVVAEVPVLFSVEASTSDFDSDIPGSNPGRATTPRRALRSKHGRGDPRWFGARASNPWAAHTAAVRFCLHCVAPRQCRAYGPRHERHGDSTRHTANVPERSKGEVLRTSGWEQPRGFEPRRWQIFFLRAHFLVVWPSG